MKDGMIELQGHAIPSPYSLERPSGSFPCVLCPPTTDAHLGLPRLLAGDNTVPDNNRVCSLTGKNAVRFSVMRNQAFGQ
jgi:hypothetical protein